MKLQNYIVVLSAGDFDKNTLEKLPKVIIHIGTEASDEEEAEEAAINFVGRHMQPPAPFIQVVYTESQEDYEKRRYLQKLDMMKN